MAKPVSTLGWLAYVGMGALFVYFVKRVMIKKIEIEDCTCKECEARRAGI